jgi:hypothetical protein
MQAYRVSSSKLPKLPLLSDLASDCRTQHGALRYRLRPIACGSQGEANGGSRPSTCLDKTIQYLHMGLLNQSGRIGCRSVAGILWAKESGAMVFRHGDGLVVGSQRCLLILVCNVT